MKFGGFQPLTLSDYPGITAAIAFTQGCNFRCPFCHNGALIPPMAAESCLLPESEILNHLRKRRGKLEGLVVTGGEPTIQPALPGFLRRVKSLGYKIKLDTNGSRPEVLAALLEQGLLDYIAMDLKAPLEKYALLGGVSVSMRALEESIALLAWSGVTHEFRTTVVPNLLTPQDLKQIESLVPAGSFWRRQAFRPEHALDPALRTA